MIKFCWIAMFLNLPLRSQWRYCDFLNTHGDVLRFLLLWVKETQLCFLAIVPDANKPLVDVGVLSVHLAFKSTMLTHQLILQVHLYFSPDAALRIHLNLHYVLQKPWSQEVELYEQCPAWFHLYTVLVSPSVMFNAKLHCWEPICSTFPQTYVGYVSYIAC